MTGRPRGRPFVLSQCGNYNLGVASIAQTDVHGKVLSFEEARRLVSRYNKLVSPNPESLWLAVRIERKLGERVTEQAYATQLRRRFPNSAEYQSLQRGQYD